MLCITLITIYGMSEHSSYCPDIEILFQYYRAETNVRQVSDIGIFFLRGEKVAVIPAAWMGKQEEKKLFCAQNYKGCIRLFP